ncbi:MAG: AzlD domain-containing protein [Planctomycetota bacterium]
MPSSKRPTPESMANVLRLLPARWAIAILVALIAYVLLQPRLNAWLGWNLPSIPALLGQETAADKRAPASKPQRDARESQGQLPAPEKSKSSSGTLKYGILKSLGRDRYESPAGLVYAPGSEEGHRLQHIERHLNDDPNRPGSHGVFRGTMEEFLVAIDDTYRRARGHAKGTRTRNEEAETIYEAPFDQAIGYLGGASGREQRNPALKRMRIVVRGKNLITAFPIP